MSFTEGDLLELEALLRAEERWSSTHMIESMYPDLGPRRRELYKKHMECFEAGAKYLQRCFMGGNGVGKTYGLGAYELALHLTGRYPFWWVGLRFDGPIVAWACGDTRDTVRRTVQKYLLGDFATLGDGELGKGTIPKEYLGNPRVVSNTNGSCDFCPVRHESGGWSSLFFKSYDQKRRSFQGDNVHFIWLDEEPPHDIFLECIQRGRGINGRILLTFTPLKGHNEVVDTFLSWEKTNKEGGSIIVVTCGWDDVPHLDEEWKAATMAATPPWLRDARKRGVPTPGIGKVYTVEEDQFVINPINIPSYWPRVYALDHGYFNTAGAWAAIDPEQDVIYIYSDYKRGEVSLDVHAIAFLARGAWIPGIGDAHQRETDGSQIIDKYKARGLNIRLAKKGAGSVGDGIEEILSRLSTGRLKVFSTCQKFLDEYRRYRYNEKQQVVKENDHILDCVRYIASEGISIATTQKRSAVTIQDSMRFG